jgi:hypothetical protein
VVHQRYINFKSGKPKEELEMEKKKEFEGWINNDNIDSVEDVLAYHTYSGGSQSDIVLEFKAIVLAKKSSWNSLNQPATKIKITVELAD